MAADIRIRSVGLPQRDPLMEMYDRFVPLGAAFGLPPCAADARREWIERALDHTVNVAAFSPAGNVVGHGFLAPDKAGSAELAIFVHQESRRRSIGTALVMAALQQGGAAGLRRVWSVTSSDNRAALCLQGSCGFRVATVSLETEMEIDLPICELAGIEDGERLQRLGQYGAAEKSLLELLRNSQTLGPGDPRTAVILNNLGSACEFQDKYSEAERYFRGALENCQSVCGKDAVLTVRFTVSLAQHYLETRQYAKAEHLGLPALAY